MKMKRILHSPYLPVLVTASLVLILPAVLQSNFQVRLATLLFIYSVVALGLNLLMGYAGQVSLGHAGFFALGAYAVAIGPAQFQLSPWLSLLLGLVLTGFIAVVIGRPVLRLSGYYLAMGTLAFGAIISITLNNEVDITGGPDGMQVARLRIGQIALSTPAQWYWIAGALLVAATAAVANLLSSSTGRALRAIHDSEVAADSLGIDVSRYKLVAFVISAMFAALAGSCLALFEGHITPVTGGILRSIEFMTMAVVGGLGSILGSIVGAGILILLPQVLVAFHEYEHAILGLILIIMMIALPLGIVPSLTLMVRRRFKW
jgi:branched-chain amino acid transport system permease protein